MTAEPITRPTAVAQRIEEVSGIRPVTLLIAFGIILITAILISTGIAANHLRQQAIDTTENELGRIDGVLSAATRLSLNAADARLAEIAARLAPGGAATLRETAAGAELAAAAQAMLGRTPRIDAIAVVSAEGELLYRAGAWPTHGVVWRDLVGPLQSPSKPRNLLGAPLKAQGVAAIPLAHPIVGADRGVIGAVVGLIPTEEFSSLFGAAPLAADISILLVEPDGDILARYPPQGAASTSASDRANLNMVFGDPSATMVRQVKDDQGEARIEAAHALGDYPLAVMVSRSTDRALAGWTHQGVWFGGFAVVGAFGIGIMIYLIARQFETHATISMIRAEKIEVERARLAAEAELLKAERLSVLGQLTATVAHELRNPLSAIRNTLFTVKELVSNSGVRLDRPIARMERSIERCDRIISDLLEYTRHRELSRTGVPFDRWLTDVVGEQHFPEQVKIRTELGAPNAVVPIDGDRVRRVVINLIENAAQALSEMPAEREKRITVRTKIEGGQMVLQIEDTGPGITPENLARIFEPLFSTKSFGTGLGLPTVKQIVNQHGGNIAVDSEVGRGTTVRVELPLEAAAAENVRVAA